MVVVLGRFECFLVVLCVVCCLLLGVWCSLRVDIRSLVLVRCVLVVGCLLVACWYVRASCVVCWLLCLIYILYYICCVCCLFVVGVVSCLLV